MPLKRSHGSKSFNVGVSQPPVPTIIEPPVTLEGPKSIYKVRKTSNQDVHQSSQSSQSPQSSEGRDQGIDDEETLDLPDVLPPILSSTWAETKVCYGMIHNSNAKLLEASETCATDKSSPASLYHPRLSFQGSAIFLLDSLDEKVAILNEETAEILRSLSALASCRFETYISPEAFERMPEKAGKTDKNQIIPADIVIYGPKSLSRQIGKLLSSSKIYLQHPCKQEPDIEYYNPHVLRFSELSLRSGLSTPRSGGSTPSRDSEDVSMLSDSEQEETSQERLQARVAKIFKSLTRFKSLRRMEADVNITTKLLPHQEEALDFMAQREFGPIPPQFSLWVKGKGEQQTYYEHAITGCRVKEAPVETIGGILADDMGLGKTLTVLSTIIRTCHESKCYAERNGAIPMMLGESDAKSETMSRATLVIISSPLLIDEWIKEIRMHCPGLLNVNIYHGRGRDLSPTRLADWDIVLSTYYTIASETLDCDSPLKKISWFRIVLDEAHLIRRMSTKLFKSVSSLSARYRWCLTGTPIQNSLEDFASLTAFIRTSSLTSLADFRKHIIGPLSRDPEKGAENLRILLDSVCLRRTKKLLNLPRLVDSDNFVEFSSEERIYYGDTQAQMLLAEQKQDNSGKSPKHVPGIFQLQLQLRRLCNHGTFQKSFSVSFDNNLQFDPDEALEYLQGRKLAKCTYCKKSIRSLDPSSEKHSGMFTVCGHLFCTSCLSRFKSSIHRIAEKDLQCSICMEKLPEDFILSQDINSDGAARPISTQALQATAVSSKINTLVHDIREGGNAKCIVFSCWTRSLDLVAHYLSIQNIIFSRVDGTYSSSQREKILADFESNEQIRILLMTTGTGAVGLNLTVASCVYILEPQWNPMVEKQAIARVQRLGQKRDVKVMRYIVRNSVEEVIRSQQARKLGFAKLGWRDDQE